MTPDEAEGRASRTHLRRALTAEAARKGEILGLTVDGCMCMSYRPWQDGEGSNVHGDALGVDGSQVGVLEERDEVS